METISKKSAMKVFYYLMAIDGEIHGEELEEFYEIGHNIDSKLFPTYKSSIIKECQSQIKNVADEIETYVVIKEAIDALMKNRAHVSVDSISVRLLVWNMLAIAFSNDEYSAIEQNIISHIVHETKMDKSTFLEMEQLIKTTAAIEREEAWIQTIDKPYSEVKPIIDELNKRQNVIIENARALIGDEMVLMEDEVETSRPHIEGNKSGFIDDVKTTIEDTVIPTASEMGENAKVKINEGKKHFKENVIPAASELKDDASKILGVFKNKIQKK